jgi:hypothetical protein
MWKNVKLRGKVKVNSYEICMNIIARDLIKSDKTCEAHTSTSSRSLLDPGTPNRVCMLETLQRIRILNLFDRMQIDRVD